MLVDESYFMECSKGLDSEVGDEFDYLNEVSQSLIEFMTRKTAEQLADMPEVILTKVKRAICAEIHYLYNLGGDKATISKVDIQKTSESYGGSYSYTIDSSKAPNVEYENGLPLAPLVKVYLLPTGLLYSGVDYV